MNNSIFVASQSNHCPGNKKLKVLVDEMFDGTDEKLRSHSYEAYSVKKLREKGEKPQSDYSILKYVEANDMVLVTENNENIDACKENGIRVISMVRMKLLKTLCQK